MSRLTFADSFLVLILILQMSQFLANAIDFHFLSDIYYTKCVKYWLKLLTMENGELPCPRVLIICLWLYVRQGRIIGSHMLKTYCLDMGLVLLLNIKNWSKVKVGVLRPVQQPGSYWDRSSELPLVGLEPTEVTAYD